MAEVFHVHTRRCHHAEDVDDRAYVERAIELGADRITFTDHAPFEGDPFKNRMSFDELPEYIDEISTIKKEFSGVIDVRVGVEIEYLPSYREYYQKLADDPAISFILLGQHFAELEPWRWSFEQEDRSGEWKDIFRAMIEGIESGWFDAVAHPDRAFFRQRAWTEEMRSESVRLISAATRCSVALEKNLCSMEYEHYYWTEFWKEVPADAKVIYGCDAHAIDEVKLC